MSDQSVNPAMPEPYVPISCEVHDEFLALASLRKECELTVTSTEGTVEQVRGLIVDVYSRNGEEYLQMKDGNVFRLDRITALNGRRLAS